YPLLPAINQDELVKQQFFHGLKPDNQIERYSAQQILGTTLHQPSHKTNSQGATLAEIEKLNNKIASLQAQLAQLAQVYPRIIRP
ncbi:hypothetical protein RhiirC2_798659, partial [Rhizophagus irregularis]